MCHLARSLDDLPKMLGLKGNWKKGVFPHKFNVPENQNYVGAIPTVEYFEPDAMKPDRRKEFEIWYAEETQKGLIWNLQEQMKEYCKSDVLVLARGLEKYDTLMKELNRNISPLTNVTLASYALTVFRNLHMPEDSIAVCSEEEYNFEIGRAHV